MASGPAIGSVVHMELHSDDPEKSKEFYRTVFGWKFQEVPGMNYAMIEMPSPPGGGIRKTDRGETAGVLNFIQVASVDGAVEVVGDRGIVESDRHGRRLLRQGHELLDVERIVGRGDAEASHFGLPGMAEPLQLQPSKRREIESVHLLRRE